MKQLSMQQVYAEPPVIIRELLASNFPHRPSTVIYAYGNLIYNPSKSPIVGWLIAHEAAHGERQIVMGVENWWNTYCTDRFFRYMEEVIAHAAEYNARCAGQCRNVRRRLLDMTLDRLLAPFYEYGESRPNRAAAAIDLKRTADKMAKGQRPVIPEMYMSSSEAKPQGSAPSGRTDGG